ncbi:PREDICTED: uncharacterized protein LOC103318612 isoform X1 [Prunus mume]|uniref:Uncharacterized protein LOC103318612 isoform X1 n=1 Tax=Prunus mume TaxID=102107 RepID=A0ABM1LQ68_PRUMU|nr:PREDICTED: uncharacterized protein LOC103318612 isoform X1 [Prunus mume]
MSRQSLVKDAWIREAEEASSLVEDLEAKTKNKHPDQLSLREIARSKLLELGMKLDRLESLLHNPPSKPILTKEDVDFRWKMLSDIQLRTRTLALSFFVLERSERLPAIKEDNKNANRCDQDEVKLSFSKDDQELLTPLLIKPSNSYTPMSLRWKTCWGISVVLGDYIDTMKGATLSDRQASAHICDVGEESVGLRKKLAAQDSGE